MNINLIKLIFPEKAKLVEAGKCPLCTNPTSAKDFPNDPLGLKEFTISGICPDCQIDIFKD